MGLQSLHTSFSRLQPSPFCPAQLMPSMKLEKMFQLAKAAWKGFTSTLQAKLHKLERSKSIKKSKTNHNSTPSTILRRRRSRSHLPCRSPPRRSKSSRCSIMVGPTSHHAHKGFAPVFVDELFKEPVPTPPVAKHVHEYCSPSMSKVIVGKATSSFPPPAAGEVKTLSAAKPEKLAAGGPSVAANGQRKSPAAKAVMETEVPRDSTTATAEVVEADHQLWGVDARAEQFILQFREEMRLERQRSFREYQEMLARGVM